MNYVIFEEFLVLLALSVVTVAVLRRLHLPPILGYLCVGMVVGPHGLQLIDDTEDTRFLAEFGVVFLLFTIGLEFSLAQLSALRRVVLGMGSVQVILSTALAGLLAWAVGTPWEGALILGGALALSSTAIVTKQLTEQLEINSRHGRTAVGVLLFQDLAVIPFLIVISILASGSDSSLAMPLLWALIKGVAAFALMVILGHWLLRPLFREIARARSTELFMLTVLLVSLTAAWTTHLAGLSLALGGFLAGVMLGETEFRHQVEADIRPFRDILLGLFFITVGMLLDLQALPRLGWWITLVVLGILIGKTLLITALGIIGRMELGVALRAGLTLAQGGEFGFALLSLAMGAGLIQDTPGQVVLAATIITMMLAPLVIRYNGSITKAIIRGYATNRGALREEISNGTRGLHDHVLICGYGRVGQSLSRFLEQEGFRYAALDLDPERVREAREAGENVFYGDSTHAEILEAAGIRHARVLVVSYDDPPSAVKVLAQAREIHPDMPVLVRSRDDSHLDELQRLGATEVVPETLEASLMLASHLLYVLGVPVSMIVRRVREIRADRYRMLRGFFPGHEVRSLDEGERQRLHAVTLPPNSAAVGKTLEELELGKPGVSVTAVRHPGGSRSLEPSPNLELAAGDVLVLYGSPEDLEHAENELMKG